MLGALFNLVRREGWDHRVDIREDNEIKLCQLLSSYKTRSWPELSLKNGPFVVFDTETTGLYSSNGDEIISLGAVIIEKGKCIEPQFYELVNPHRAIPSLATQITGINDSMVRDAPDIITVLERFIEFAGFNVLVAHHAPFDLGFINAKLRKYCGQKLYMPVLDTYLLSNLVSPWRATLLLEGLAAEYGISSVGRHHALGDALITAQLFISLVEELAQRGITTTSDIQGSHKFNRLI